MKQSIWCRDVPRAHALFVSRRRPQQSLVFAERLWDAIGSVNSEYFHVAWSSTEH